ncbi:MAG: HAMP domain-containing protein [Chromatiales bacterium]|nr:HAMP domain-containing protein [Chromatiales bacterium]
MLWRIDTSNPHPSFRRRLLLTYTLGVLGLALATSLATAWVANYRSGQLLMAQGIEITENLARQSVLALLYGSGENAADAVRETMNFPAVSYAAIQEPDGTVLISGGHINHPAGERPASESQGADRAYLLADGTRFWLFSAPVFSPSQGADDNVPEYAAVPPEPERLGRVLVGVSKKALHTAQFSVFLNNGLVTMALALVLLAVLNIYLSRLTIPLKNLHALMEQAEAGDTRVRAKIEGPMEVAHIARVFNQMMEALAERDRRLREHNELLESEVALRTRELVYARDAALAASQQKSEFLANVTHELRTPLQSIIGYTDVSIEMLEDEGLDELASDSRRVLNSAQHLLTLINDLLDMARIEAGRLQLNPEPVAMSDVVDEVAGIIAPLLKANGNELDVHISDGGVRPTLDRGRIMQILLNLAGNAAKFTRQGHIRISVRAMPAELTMAVKDDGIGIAESQQQRIFEHFRQADGSTTRRFQGAGLGLAITRQLCELMGGSIGLRSRLGEGAEFTVHIPLTGAPDTLNTTGKQIITMNTQGT